MGDDHMLYLCVCEGAGEGRYRMGTESAQMFQWPDSRILVTMGDGITDAGRNTK